MNGSSERGMTGPGKGPGSPGSLFRATRIALDDAGVLKLLGDKHAATRGG